MNRRVYAIRDRVSDDLVGRAMYLLMVFRNDAEAARYFADAVNDTTSIINKHPADYELVSIANLDDKGNFYPHDRAVVVTGDSVVALQEEIK